MTRATLAVLLFLLLAVPTLLLAQGAGSGQAAQPVPHAPSGGNREMISSIFIPALTGAPFSAAVVLESTKTLEDGTTITLYNHRQVLRDSAGRIFQERQTLVPKDGQHQPQVWRLEISDPSAHKKYFCAVQQQTCEVFAYASPPAVVQSSGGQVPAGKGNFTRESLGTSLLNGVEAVGTRETTVLNTGVIGNDRPISIVREFWYSPRLGINLIEKRSDPRSGTVTIGVTEISLTEPDAKYFVVPPAGYSLAKQASGAAPGGRSF